MTGLSLLIGFSSAMETFCGQAYGAGRYDLLGLVLQRALLLLTLVAAAVALLWTQMEGVLLALGQDGAIAHQCACFLVRATPALWFTGVFEALKRYLMAQVSGPGLLLLLLLLLPLPLPLPLAPHCIPSKFACLCVVHVSDAKSRGWQVFI